MAKPSNPLVKNIWIVKWRPRFLFSRGAWNVLNVGFESQEAADTWIADSGFRDLEYATQRILLQLDIKA